MDVESEVVVESVVESEVLVLLVDAVVVVEVEDSSSSPSSEGFGKITSTCPRSNSASFPSLSNTFFGSAGGSPFLVNGNSPGS